jgi:hypothetical protein
MVTRTNPRFHNVKFPFVAVSLLSLLVPTSKDEIPISVSAPVDKRPLFDKDAAKFQQILKWRSTDRPSAQRGLFAPVCQSEAMQQPR